MASEQYKYGLYWVSARAPAQTHNTHTRWHASIRKGDIILGIWILVKCAQCTGADTLTHTPNRMR